MNRSFTAEEWPSVVGKRNWYDAVDEAREMVDLQIETDIQATILMMPWFPLPGKTPSWLEWTS